MAEPRCLRRSALWQESFNRRAVLIGLTPPYDAILLDVDNGPEGLTRKVNHWLYSPAGLVAARAALRPDGVLAIWSASPDPDFVQLLTQGGFTVNVVPVAASEDQPGDVKSHEHVLIFARK